MVKRFLSLVICLTVFCSVVSVGKINIKALDGAEITAPSAILIDADSGKVLFEKDSHQIRACASITKVMTLLLVMEAIDSGKISLNDTVTASAHAASMGGSDIWLETGETMSVDDMLKATVVASANDAAVALAELISGTEDEFVIQMNSRAKELGMNDTVFKNCNGLDEEGHLTSAYDVAIMSRELIKHEKIYDYTSIWIDYLRDGKTQLVNTNKLLKSYNGITGLKTGTTSQAGCCISATARRNGLSLIAVVLGSTTGQQRFKDASVLLDYGFANYEVATLDIPQDLLTPLDVKKGMQKTAELSCTVADTILINKGDKSKITSEFYKDTEIEAPVLPNTQVGTLTYKIGDNVIAEYPILTADTVEEMTFKAVIKIMFDSLIKL